MEIEIPDLDDVKFTKLCSACMWQNKVNCGYCNNKKFVITPVGNKLMHFLKDVYGLVPKEIELD